MFSRLPFVSTLLAVAFGIALAPALASAQATGSTSNPYVVKFRIDASTIPVSIAGAPELAGLAKMAFGFHGRYELVREGGAYTFTFTSPAANQVRVDITSKTGVAQAQIFSGATLRQALFRAADFAVAQTNAQGLKPWFASRLAFIGEVHGATEVCTGDLFFGEVKQITNDHKEAMTPRLSRDGRKILYTSFYRTFPDIYEIDLGSYQRSVIASFKGTNSGGRYSPDGSRIAMVLSGQGNPDIYVSDARGRGVRRRTNTPNAVEASPVWSPDGSQLLFTSDAGGSVQLFVMSAEGGTMSRLPTQISGYCAEPDWSRGDPSKIAFTARVGRNYQIAVFDLGARTPAQVVSSAPLDAVEAAWLADGRHLIYTSRTANRRRLYILDTISQKAHQLSPDTFGNASQASVQAP